MRDEVVRIYLYGKEIKMERGVAMEYYMNKIFDSDGNERNRYMNIVKDLMAGRFVCLDRCGCVA